MNADQLADLLGAAAVVPRMPDAACRGEVWLADLDVSSNRGRIDAGIETCLGCRELQRCKHWFDGLPADHRPRGVVAASLVDPDAPRTAREAMLAERKRPPRPATQPRKGPLRVRLLAAAEAAGGVGLTVREAAAVLYGPGATLNQAEQTRQALERMRRRGVLRRVDRGQTSARGRVSRYVRVDVEAAAS